MRALFLALCLLVLALVRAGPAIEQANSAAATSAQPEQLNTATESALKDAIEMDNIRASIDNQLLVDERELLLAHSASRWLNAHPDADKSEFFVAFPSLAPVDAESDNFEVSQWGGRGGWGRGGWGRGGWGGGW